MHLFKLTDEQLTHMVLPERFKTKEHDKIELTFDELVEIVSKARTAGPRLVQLENPKEQ